MRKDRYITSDEIADIDRITNLRWEIDQKNQVSIRWAWPRNGGIKLAAVFTSQASSDSLDELLENSTPIIITKDMDKSYSKPLDGSQCIYRVFPAHFGEGSDIVILNQQSGNSTGIITKLITVEHRIDYKALPLSDYQRVSLNIRSSGALPNGALAYAKYRNGARICEYPAPSRDGAYVCYVKKNEVISLYVTDEYSGNVLLGTGSAI